MSDRSGYIGRAPGDTSVTIARQKFEPTGVQTNFTFTSGYSVGYVDCYLNGIRLIEGSDYTAQNGSVVGLTSFANNGDVVELVAYKAFNATAITDATSNFSVGGNLTVNDNLIVSGTTSGVSSATAVPGINTGGHSVLTTLKASGITTISATTSSTSTTTGALIVSGGVGIAKSLFIGEGVSVAGTITYNDVTNVDSVGVVTAGGGLRIGTGGTVGPAAAGVVTYYGDGSQLTGISTAAVPGISTQLHSVFGTVNASGIITASAFKGDGSTLSNVGGDTDITSCLFI